MTVREYEAWWSEHSEDPDLPPIVVTLAAHVDALQERINRLPHPDRPGPSTWATQCACAYDHPDAVCMAHGPLMEAELK